MTENDKTYFDELQRIDELKRTYESAYRHGFYDGIQFISTLLKDENISKVFKDGNIFR